MAAYEIVVIGVSTGGLYAIETLLGGLPADFALPMIVVQHRSVDSEGGPLRSLLQSHTALRVREPSDKEAIRGGTVYIAPADYHLLVEPGAFALSTEGPVSYARPSIDVLFLSAVDAYAGRVIGIILTGANQDGAQGAAYLKAHGGFLIVQEPATAESAAMPRAALESTRADRVLPLAEIASCLAQVVSRNTA
jgi:two-component system chemotaxis response regulator CheB